MGFRDLMFGKAPTIPKPPAPRGFKGATGSVDWTPEGYSYSGPELSPEETARQGYFTDLQKRMTPEHSDERMQQVKRFADTQAKTDTAMKGLLGYKSNRPDIGMGIKSGRLYEDVMRRVGESQAVAGQERSLASRGLGEQQYQQGEQNRQGLLAYAGGRGQQTLQNRMLQEQATLAPAQAATNYELRNYQSMLPYYAQTGTKGIFPGVMQTIGSVIGGVFGGSAGGKIGGKVGKSLGTSYTNYDQAQQRSER